MLSVYRLWRLGAVALVFVCLMCMHTAAWGKAERCVHECGYMSRKDCTRKTITPIGPPYDEDQPGETTRQEGCTCPYAGATHYKHKKMEIKFKLGVGVNFDWFEAKCEIEVPIREGSEITHDIPAATKRKIERWQHFVIKTWQKVEIRWLCQLQCRCQKCHQYYDIGKPEVMKVCKDCKQLKSVDCTERLVETKNCP